jgi:hypothetical protein
MDYNFRFVVASHNEKTLRDNLLRSDMVHKYPLLVQKNFKNVAEAYNNACNVNVFKDSPVPADQIVIYVHHDVFLPVGFEAQLIDSLQRLPKDWAVAGPAGVRLINGKKNNFGHINDRGRVWGEKLYPWAPVQTLDELLLITQGDIVFDEQFPQDFYGADICMQANVAGKTCYAINAFCDHNSSRVVGGRTAEFYDAEKKFRFKWFRHLPIVTTCSMLT